MEFYQEQPEDFDEVEFLYDLCFAPGRQGLSSYQLREGIDPVDALSMIARDESGALIGAIRYWPVDAGGKPCLLLGPVAVHPTMQGMGIAAILIRRTLELARQKGWERAVLIGDEPYYRRFGFSHDKLINLHFPPPTNPARFLGLELVGGAFEGLKGEIKKAQS